MGPVPSQWRQQDGKGTMNAKEPTPGKAYYAWQNYVIKEWQPGRARDSKLQLAGFAIVLASFGKYGKGLFPSARELAERARISESTVKRRLRPKVIEYGLF